MRQSYLLKLLAAAGLALSRDAVSAEREPSETLPERVAELTSDYRAKRPFGALAVGVLRDGKRETFGFGVFGDQKDQSAVDDRTLFEVGSCTKVFTSLSLAALVARGEVSLDDSIVALLPEAELSDDVKQITLRELSTHTSGLPRIPLGMFVDAIFKSGNPYRDYTATRLLDVLKTWKAPRRKTFGYSNFGVGLLGYGLAQKTSAADYGQMLEQSVTGPLGLRDTVVTLNEEQQKRLAIGYGRRGGPESNWDFDALAGCGALRSDVADLLTFLEQMIHPEASPLKDAIELSQMTQYEQENVNKQLSVKICLGWLVAERNGLRILWHNGATGAYRSFFAFERNTGVAVVFLSNTGDAAAADEAIDVMGMSLLEELAKARVADGS